MNAINPATVVTNFFTAAGMSQAQAEAYMDKSAKTHPIGRVGLPADIAELCYFLTETGKAGWITGQVCNSFGSQFAIDVTAELSVSTLRPDALSRSSMAWNSLRAKTCRASQSHCQS